VFTEPLIIAFISALLKHEVLARTKVLCLFAGFFGVVLAVALRPWENGEGIGYVAALGSILFYSVSTIALRKIAETETAESLQFWRAGAIGLSGLLGVFFLQAGTFPGSMMLAMLFVAGAVNVVGNVLYNKALQHAPASDVEQFHYTQLIFGAIIGYVLWHEMPTWNLIAGSALIVGSGLVVAAQARKASKI
jgi:drug/metabolite transporter (DMT)-like permease